MSRLQHTPEKERSCCVLVLVLVVAGWESEDARAVRTTARCAREALGTQRLPKGALTRCAAVHCILTLYQGDRTQSCCCTGEYMPA